MLHSTDRTTHLSHDDHRARQRHKHSQPRKARAGALCSESPWTRQHTGGFPVNTHSTPVPTTVGRLWVAQQHCPHHNFFNIFVFFFHSVSFSFSFLFFFFEIFFYLQLFFLFFLFFFFLKIFPLFTLFVHFLNFSFAIFWFLKNFFRFLIYFDFF